MSVLDKVQKKQRPLLDLLVDQISSIDQPESTLEETLNSLDSVWINQSHSTSGLSPLEALINRYPQITLSDLRLFDTLLDRGADLEKVDKGILIRMMEIENEGVDSVAKRFERELIDKFDELGRVKVPSTATTTEYTQNRFSSPEQSIRAYPSSGLSSPYSRSITPSSYPSRSRDDSSLNRRSPSRSPSIDSISPDTSRSNFYNDKIPPFNVSEPRSLSPNNRSSLSEQIQISLPLPEGTSISSLYYYFRQVLGARIENITLHTDGQDSFALFEIDKELFESGELRTRIEEMEERKPFVRNGRAWKLTPIEYKEKADYVYARDEEEEPRFASLPSSATFARNDTEPSSSRWNGCEDHSRDARRYCGRSRLSRIEDDRRSSSRRQEGSPATCGSRREFSKRRLCSGSRSPTRRRRREDRDLKEELGRCETRRERDYESESEEERNSRWKAHRRSRSPSPAERSRRLSPHRIRSLKPDLLHHSPDSRNQDTLLDDNLFFENSIHSADSADPSRSTSSTSHTLNEYSFDCPRPSFEPSTSPSRHVFESADQLQNGSLAYSQSSQSSHSVENSLLSESIKLGKHTIGSKDKSEQEEQRSSSSSGGTFESGSRFHWRKENPWREPYRDRDRARYDYKDLEYYY